jgi:uncharacterized protein YkwD
MPSGEGVGNVRRFAAVILFVAALLAPGSAFATPAVPVGSSTVRATDAANYCADPEELAMLNELNAYRAENGAGELTLSVALGAAAKHHSESMASFNYFDGSHDLHFEGANQDETVTWQQNIANHGYPDNTHTSRAENLAAGFEKATETLLQWQNSPSHNDHLLSTKYKAVGIGRAFNPESEYRWYWTVTFGSLVDAPAAPCEDTASSEGAPEAGSELSVTRSGRNGSSTESNVAYDGDEATAWYTTKARTPTTGYVWFDFGGVTSLSRVAYVFSRSGGADAFEVQVSNDRDEWTTIAELEGPDAGEWGTFEWSGEARYVRFYFTNPEQVDVLGYLAEVRFYA